MSCRHFVENVHTCCYDPEKSRNVQVRRIMARDVQWGLSKMADFRKTADQLFFPARILRGLTLYLYSRFALKEKGDPQSREFPREVSHFLIEQIAKPEPGFLRSLVTGKKNPDSRADSELVDSSPALFSKVANFKLTSQALQLPFT